MTTTVTPARTLHIIYRHIPIGAEKNSRDPHKSRPPWFSYQTCLRNLLMTVRADPQAARVKITLLFDGAPEDFLADFSAGYHGNPELGVQLQLVRGGSNGASFLIALDMVRRWEVPRPTWSTSWRTTTCTSTAGSASCWSWLTRSP